MKIAGILVELMYFFTAMLYKPDLTNIAIAVIYFLQQLL